ncbi:MAG: hypothetical protein DHS20C18_21770 [Saprospiraceae bacterium]|nr:MAG: hypothetical protein DHS20C18_21770 [Saprospiraceae bacterium]
MDQSLKKHFIENWKKYLKIHSLEIQDFLYKSLSTSNSYSKTFEAKTDIGFNVFTLASDLYYRENFHSDIIKSFLDPNGAHNENSKYLHTFIDLLNKGKSKNRIEVKDFQYSTIERERNNVDILVTDEFSRKAIIIENKINNAVDQKRQLPRYFEIVRKDFEVVAIVYLTLNSSKRPDKNDWTDEELETISGILKIIPAYEPITTNPSLYTDWILPSIILSDNIDSSLILRQYGKLIQYLNTNTMDTVTLGKFYDSLKQDDNLEVAISIRNMLNDFPEYLAIRIEDRYKENCHPFKKIWRYQKRDAVFEAFEFDDYYIKIDVWCDENGYTVHFWDTNGKDVISDFKKRIAVLSDFEIYKEGTGNIKKRFHAFEEAELFKFIDEIIKELKLFKKNDELGVLEK